MIINTTPFIPNDLTMVTRSVSSWPMPVETPPKFEPKKAGTKTAHVIFVLDDSYSMQSCKDATIKGFNEFLDGQRKNDVTTYVSFYKFNGSEVLCEFDHVNIKYFSHINKESYDPRGSTNLNDALGEVMHQVNNRLAGEKKKNRDQVTVVLLTDGEENSSRKYTNDAIKCMVSAAEEKQWSFMFLGANIDAFHTGGNLGFGVHNTLQYSTGKMGSTMMAASRMASDMSTLKAAGVSNNDAYASAAFTSEERKEADE